MIRVKTCFVAEGVVTDRDTDQISAFGLLEHVEAASYPLAIQKLAFFCLWGRASTDPQLASCEFSVTLNGKDIVRHGVNIDFQQFLRNRCTIKLDGFVLNEPGDVTFRLAIPGHDTAEWTLEAGRSAAETQGAGPRPTRPVYDSGQYSMSPGDRNLHRR